MIKWLSRLQYATYGLLVLFLSNCQTPEREYKRLEKKELAKEQRQDSLFLGIHFGMSNQEFRDYCYAMNLNGIFKQGGLKNLIWVECKLPNQLDYPGAINFYPEFTHDTITGMNAAIYYEDATFRDGVFESDSLLLDVLELANDWYGGKYFKIKSPFFYKDDVYVKINANRRITIYPDLSGQIINLWYKDLKPRVKPEIDS